MNKTKLLKKEAVFLNDFSRVEDVSKEFGDGAWDNPKNVDLDGIKILFADYTYENYSGDAYVLGYDKNSKQFFENFGNHCSCYGLEGQWEPEYYDSWDQLEVCIKKRFDSKYPDSYYQDASTSEQLKEFLEL